MKKVFFSVFVIFFLCSNVFSEKIDVVTVEKQTIKNNPLLKAARLELNSAREEYYEVFSLFLPRIIFNGDVYKSGAKNFDYIKQYSMNLKGSLSLFEGFSSFNKLKEKSAKLKIAQSSYDRAVADTRYYVHACYVNLVWSYETVSLLETIRGRRKENRDLIKLKYDSGNVDIGFLEKCYADLLSAEYNLEKAKRSIQTASNNLLCAIGISGDIILEPTERLLHTGEVFFEPNYDNLITSIPEFLETKYNLEMYKAISRKTNGQLLPSLNLSCGVNKQGASFNTEQRSQSIGLNVSYEVFSGGLRYRNVKMALNDVKVASYKLINKTSYLKSKAIGSYNTLVDACGAISVRILHVNASKLQSEIAIKKYINGLCSYYDWYFAENDYIAVQQNLLDARKTAALAEAEWLNFIGKGFDQQ